MVAAPKEELHVELASTMPEYKSVSHMVIGNELLFQPAQIQPFEQKPKRSVLKNFTGFSNRHCTDQLHGDHGFFPGETQH